MGEHDVDIDVTAVGLSGLMRSLYETGAYYASIVPRCEPGFEEAY